MNIHTYKKGFTLIEVLVVIGIIGVLAGVVLVAVNPGKQFKQARETARIAHLNTLLNAINQNMTANKGQLVCAGVPLAYLSPRYLEIRSDVAGRTDAINISYCLIPLYLPELPADPKTGFYKGMEDYVIGYSVKWDEKGRVSVKAKGELQDEIVITR